MPRKKKFSHGGCDFERTQPSTSEFNSKTKMLNVILSFEDALKLNIAIQSCLQKINAQDHRTKNGKNAAMNIAIHFDINRITINEKPLKGRL